MLIIKFICISFVALIFAMPIMFPNTKIRAVQPRRENDYED